MRVWKPRKDIFEKENREDVEDLREKKEDSEEKRVILWVRLKSFRELYNLATTCILETLQVVYFSRNRKSVTPLPYSARYVLLHSKHVYEIQNIDDFTMFEIEDKDYDVLTLYDAMEKDCVAWVVNEAKVK